METSIFITAFNVLVMGTLGFMLKSWFTSTNKSIKELEKDAVTRPELNGIITRIETKMDDTQKETKEDIKEYKNSVKQDITDLGKTIDGFKDAVIASKK